jgi:hypothetical protein
LEIKKSNNPEKKCVAMRDVELSKLNQVDSSWSDLIEINNGHEFLPIDLGCTINLKVNVALIKVDA